MRISCARPALTLAVAFVLAAVGAGYAAHTLTLETSKFHLLPLHQRYATLYKEYAEDFGQLEDIVVVVQSPAVETSTAYAARLARVLRDGALGTARVSYRIDASRFETHVMLYLPLETLHATLRTVAGQEDLLADFAATPTLAGLVEGINLYIGATFLPGVFGPGGEDEASAAPTRLLRDLLTQMSERIDGRPYRSPWESLFGAPIPAPDGGYFMRPAPALRRGRPRRCDSHLRRRARGGSRRPARDRESPPRVSVGRGRRHRSPRALQ